MTRRRGLRLGAYLAASIAIISARSIVYADAGEIVIDLFSRDGCSACGEAIRYIEALDAGSRIDLNVYSLDEPGGESLLARYLAATGIGAPPSTPIVFIGLTAIAGFDRFAIDQAVFRYDSGQRSSLESRISAIGAEEAYYQKFAGLNWAVVAVAGFIDGFNPCSISAILFFASMCALSGGRRFGIISVGVPFILGIVGVNLTIGIAGLRGAYGIVDSRTALSIALNSIGSALFLFLALRSVRRGTALLRGDVAIDVGTRKRLAFTHRFIRRLRALPSAVAIPAAFIVGSIVGLAETGCSGQIYVPTLLFMAGNSDSAARAVNLLIAYNVAYAVPLAFVLISAVFTSGSAARRGPLGRIATSASVQFAFSILSLAGTIYFAYEALAGIASLRFG